MLPGVSLEWMCFPETIKIFQQFNNSDYAEVFSKKYTQQCTRISRKISLTLFTPVTVYQQVLMIANLENTTFESRIDVPPLRPKNSQLKMHIKTFSLQSPLSFVLPPPVLIFDQIWQTNLIKTQIYQDCYIWNFLHPCNNLKAISFTFELTVLLLSKRCINSATYFPFQQPNYSTREEGKTFERVLLFRQNVVCSHFTPPVYSTLLPLLVNF